VPADPPGHRVTESRSARVSSPARIHLDTDIGSDTDDLCALAMLIGWPGVELAGVTTNTDPAGIRAGFTRYALALAGRESVPVRAGAEGTLAEPMAPVTIPAYWPEPIERQPSPPGAAIELIARSAESGSTIVAIGPYTNLAAFEAWFPGGLAEAGTVLMGGHVPPAPAGFPPWGARDDVNVQQDAVAARIVFERCAPTVVPVSTALRVAVRRRHLDRLRAAGPLGTLVADQAEAHARDNGRAELPSAYPALPHDLLNFQYDPLACAVACGWDGAAIEEIRVKPEIVGRRLRLPIVEKPVGIPMRVVMHADGERLARDWSDAVVRASTRGAA
jgi:inosine-uridine nucleoside N-ribohydrolase